jgi:Tat protein secretion system quality control protein TatD with DNase activity
VLIEIANLRNIDVEELEKITEKNSIELFGLEV